MDKILSVTFIKRSDGTERQITCRRGVRAGVKGGPKPYADAEHNLVTVFDMQRAAKQVPAEECYRSIPLDSLVRVTVDKKTYEVTIPVLTFRAEWATKEQGHQSVSVQGRTKSEAERNLKERLGYRPKRLTLLPVE